MPYCPNCGRHISLGDTSCSECGCSLADGMEDIPEPGAESSRDGPSRRAPRHRDDQEGKTRRTALAFAGGVLGLMVLVTWGLELLDERGPKDVVADWRTAWTAGDVDAYRDLWHSESPRDATGRGDDLPDLAAPDERLQYTGETRELLEGTETDVLVRDVFLLTHPEFETPRRVTDVIDLRTEDGNWRIWDYRTERSERLTDCSRSITMTGLGTLECE